MHSNLIQLYEKSFGNFGPDLLYHILIYSALRWAELLPPVHEAYFSSLAHLRTPGPLTVHTFQLFLYFVHFLIICLVEIPVYYQVQVNLSREVISWRVRNFWLPWAIKVWTDCLGQKRNFSLFKVLIFIVFPIKRLQQTNETPFSGDHLAHKILRRNTIRHNDIQTI